MPSSFPLFAAPLRQAVLTFAAGGWPSDRLEQVGELYERFAPALTWPERHQLYFETLDVFRFLPVRVSALVPFLLSDDDWLLVRRAAYDTWRLWSRDPERADQDVVRTMFRSFRSHAADPDHVVRAGAMLAGIVQAAPAGRPLVRLHGAWRLLDREGRHECLRQMVGTDSLSALRWLDAWRIASDDAEEVEHLRMIIEGALHRAWFFRTTDAHGEEISVMPPQARTVLERRWRRLLRCEGISAGAKARAERLLDPPRHGVREACVPW